MFSNPFFFEAHLRRKQGKLRFLYYENLTKRRIRDTFYFQFFLMETSSQKSAPNVGNIQRQAR